MEAMIGASKTYSEVGQLFATAEGNWDYYAVEQPDRSRSPYCYSVAKPTSGASTSSFGDLRHICNLIREDGWAGEFTEFGRQLMIKYGYENYLKRYEEMKKYKIEFFDSSRWYGKLLRTVIVKAKSRSEAFSRAYEIRQKDAERDLVVTRVKTAAA